jgi:ligand-binding sensor domain-containing protein/serine phosphatase RsbU (regulator of sigma subunit)
MKLRIVLLLQVLLFTFCLSSEAQNNNFRKWSVNDGLPNSVVYKIIQDKRGLIWFATESGASSFNGKRFKTYTTKEGLAGNEIRTILEDSKGRLWFATDKGLSIYDGYKFRTLNNNNGLTGNKVLCLLEDHQHFIWAGTDDGGLNRITEVSIDSFSIKCFEEKQGLGSNSVFDLFEDKDQDLWIATMNGGLNILKISGNSAEIKVISGESNIPSDLLLSVAGDAKGNVWIGSYDAGAFRMKLSDKNTDRIEYEQYNTAKGLNSNSVWDVTVSGDGNVWLGTMDKGISRLSAGKGAAQSADVSSYTVDQGLSGNQIYCIFQDRENNIWIGTNGDGVCMLTGEQFSHYNKRDGLPENKIQDVTQDAAGNLWLASSGGGFGKMSFASGVPSFQNYSTKDGFVSEYASSIAVGNENNKNIWIGTSNDGIVAFDGKAFRNFTESEGLISNRVYDVTVDSKGIVWCATANGISRFGGKDFENISTEKLKMSDEGIKSVMQDSKGNIWFASAGGLARYSEIKELRTFDEVEGLASKNVNTITESPKGNIWIGTNEGGLYKFDISKNDTAAISFIAADSLLGSNTIRSLVFYDNATLIAGTLKGFVKITLNNSEEVTGVRAYDATDGFTGIECNENAICRDLNGNIWFGTVNGLTRYSPTLEKKVSPKPVVSINNIQLFFKDVDWSTKADSVLPWSGLPSTLKLPYTENHLTFKFSAISFSNPEKIKYKYILEGRDKVWSPESSSDEITYSGINPGTYTFKVMAVNADGKWSDPAVFYFSVTPPWYQTKLFYVSATVLLILLFFGYTKFRERKLINEKKVLEETVAERTREVVLQKEHIAEKNREITDSINYAKRIQNAILPDLTNVYKAFPQSFVLYKPKDIVSGDFYWYCHGDGEMIAAADCTGHGVPGAFMSTIGVERLNDSVKQTSHPGEVLSLLNRAVKTSLRQGEEGDVNEKATRDGMDIALVNLKQNGESANLQYAAANRPLWIIRNGSTEVEETKATKIAIGGLTPDDQVFETHDIILSKGDSFYLFSDGYADQFSVNDKKLMTKQFKKALIDVQHLSMEEQREALDVFIENWKSGAEQTDDILVIGVRI